MAETIQYKCPCCGGRLEFDSGLQKMKCPYCDTTFDVETLEGYDDALKQDAADDMHWDAAQQPWDDVQMGVYTCKSCGGELVCDESTAATACPFCGNPIVLTGRLSGDLKPDYVIPFKLDKKAAEAALRNHMKGKRLLPNLFRSENRISEVKGVYVPFWLFDADADAHIRYHFPENAGYPKYARQPPHPASFYHTLSILPTVFPAHLSYENPNFP